MCKFLHFCFCQRAYTRLEMQNTATQNSATKDLVLFDAPTRELRHWKLSINGRIATLTMNVDEDGGLRPGYKLKLNSYDLGVDIELHNILQRLRFEHPEVACVILTSAKDRMFCAGANIYMLGSSSHAWKVNFCKFTNETRNGMEDSSRHDGLKFLAALNGTTAGGGYELALACDEIILIDDRSSAVSLPETPLLGVLPGTGGLTRVVDKRRVRRDLADLFCTNPDGVKGERAKSWGLVDELAAPANFAKAVQARAERLVESSPRAAVVKGIELRPLQRKIDDSGYHYSNVDVSFDREARTATVTVRAPLGPQPATIEQILAEGAGWWPLQMSRELDDAILSLRTNQLELGLWILKTAGDWKNVLHVDSVLFSNRGNWFVREVIGMMRRTLARLDVTSRSIYAVIEPGSCFAGSLMELGLAADRVYMLDDPQSAVTLSEMNFGELKAVNGLARLEARFYGDQSRVSEMKARIGKPFGPREAAEAGLVTFTPDELDWSDEIRLAIESRLALSPDAMTGLEANLRFGKPENMNARIFGRLSAWQNWIFVHPNAVGTSGALKVYGTGSRAKFDWERV